MDETSSPCRARRMVTGETLWTGWDRVRLAHNPEVAGSNPAPRYQRVSGITAGQRLANCCWRAFGVSGVVCTLTKSLTPDVSGVPQSLSLDGRIGTRERNQDDPGDVRRRSSGRSPGGRRRVRPARRLARDRFMASPHILPRPRSTANTPRRLAKDHAVC
jgi:hypothetical protein